MKLLRNFGDTISKCPDTIRKMPQRRDNAGAVCNSGMGILFLCISFFLHYFFEGGVDFFFMHDA